MNRSLITFFFILWLCIGTFLTAEAQPAPGDSAYWDLSLPEIQSYKAYYMQELEAYQNEKQTLIQRGIDDGERLLLSSPESKVIDDVLIRLADLYYYREKDDYFARLEQYDEQLELYERGELVELPEEPRIVYAKSMEMYQRIVDEFPQSDLVDDAVYSKGFLFEEMGDHNRANQIYQHLINDFSDSKYVPEALMRLGEYYFNPPINDIYRAIDYYERVTKYKNSPRYDESLYKLGWSHYRLDQYPEAISYFTMIVEGSEPSVGTENEKRTDLRDEALEYIAISFVDFGGPANARKYLGKIGDPDWGDAVMEKLGDIYKEEKEEYRNAVSAYQALLDYAPHSPDAPKFQKKIIDSYKLLKQETLAFEARQKLFMMYKPESTWWEATDDDKLKLSTYRLTEQALRENIQSLIRDAKTYKNRTLFEKAVELAQTYLNHYPEDLYAYMIRWNMALILDTELQDYEDALKEYLTISLVYQGDQYEKFAGEKGLATIQDAAENAIVVADSLIRQEQKQQPASAVSTENGGSADGATAEPIPFTQAERWLAAAYDNYIKLFPFDEKTAAILVNGGILHYTHNQFDEAIKYFKTLTEYFPDNKEIHKVMNSIMESYFGKQDYTSAEVVAKRIIESDAPADVQKKALSRLGESIFLKAESLAKQGHDRIAADEYYRMALEAPTLAFADKALFNSGRGYDKLKAYPFAIRAYEQLCASYPGSEFFIDAMNNLAFDYVEVGDFEKAAGSYEKLADTYKKGDKARDALYNAWVFYAKTENWQKSIDVGKRYASEFAGEKEAPSIYFSVAGYYLNLQDIQNALNVYIDFPARFPKSPLGVEAYFHAGRKLEEMDRLQEAETTYQKAYHHSLTLKGQNLEANDYFAAEALYFASCIDFDQYKTIEFRLPQSALKQALNRKQKLLGKLVRQYTAIAAYATHRLPESVYRIGELYEEYADAWYKQELPPLDPTSRAVREKEINEEAVQFYHQSLTAFQKAHGVLGKLVSEMAERNQHVSMDSMGVDSVLIDSESWLSRSQIKISKILYQMAEVSTQSIDHLLKAPIPAELEGLARLEYQSQLLVRAIKPLLDVVIEGHFRNLTISDSLNISNEWVTASKSRILEKLPLMGSYYEDLCVQALHLFRESNRQFRQIIFNRQYLDSQDPVNTMVSYIEIAKSYAEASLVFYREAAGQLDQSPFYPDDVTSGQKQMVSFAILAADTLESLIHTARTDQFRAGVQYEKTGELIFEEALTAFEDNIYYLEDNLIHILETAYDFNALFKRPTPISGWLPVRLARFDQAYIEKFNLPVETINVMTDTTWRYTWVFNPGWKKYNFKMVQWLYLKNGVSDSLSADPVPADTTGRQVFGISSFPEERTFYIRKSFRIPGSPVISGMEIKTSCPYRLYINEQMVSSSENELSYGNVPYLKREGNVIGVELIARHTFSLKGTLKIQYIPNDALPKEL